MTRARAALLAAVVTASLPLGACGDDDGGGGGGGDALTRDEFRKRAAALCAADTKAAKPIAQKTTTSKEQYIQQLEDLLAINVESRPEFGDLEPPEEVRDAYDDFLRANDEGADKTQQIIDRLKDGESQKEVFRGATATDVVKIGRRRAEAARRMGVPQCGSSI